MGQTFARERGVNLCEVLIWQWCASASMAPAQPSNLIGRRLIMRLARWKTAVGTTFLAMVLSVPAWSAYPEKRSAMPGTLNYVEGQASIADQTLDSKAVGATELQPGQTLRTGNGKAEILLTPGVYLRLGSNSAVNMISPSLTNTEVALNQGQAMLEVDEIHSENNIRLRQSGADTRVLKTGLYE